MLTIFEPDDGPLEKAGSVIGAIVVICVYGLLIWTVLHTIV